MIFCATLFSFTHVKKTEWKRNSETKSPSDGKSHHYKTFDFFPLTKRMWTDRVRLSRISSDFSTGFGFHRFFPALISDIFCNHGKSRSQAKICFYNKSNSRYVYTSHLYMRFQHCIAFWKYWFMDVNETNVSTDKLGYDAPVSNEYVAITKKIFSFF